MHTRRKIIAILVVMAIIVMGGIPAAADTGNTATVMVNNQFLNTNVSPVIENGILWVPAREFVSQLGGSFTYDAATMSGTIRCGENEIVYRLENTSAKYNGKFISVPAGLRIIKNRWMIPAEFTALKLGVVKYTHTGRNLTMFFQPVEGKVVYQVMAGDSLWLLSNIFRTGISSMKQLNGLSGDVIYVGQKLTVGSFTAPVSELPSYTSGGATLRSGPGFDYSVVNYLQAWTSIIVIGKNGEWYHVRTPRGEGYIYYTVTYIKQDMSDNTTKSTYFEQSLPVDTSMDSVTYSPYTVQKGDSIWAISEKVGVLDYELAQANAMSPYAVLYPGQVIKVPVHQIAVKNKVGTGYGEVLDWFTEGQYVFPINKVGKLIDLETGKSFTVERTMGANHSDTETLTPEGTKVMKEIFGGSWNWTRRPFILEVDGRQFAVSVAGMPHAGVDGAPYLQNVSNRSDNWGDGPNYDRIAGNGMEGHFDVYFLNSIRHVDNKIDAGHQQNVLIAGGLQ